MRSIKRVTAFNVSQAAATMLNAVFTVMRSKAFKGTLKTNQGG